MKEQYTLERRGAQSQKIRTNSNRNARGADSPSPSSLSRRAFLESLSGVTAATIAVGVVGVPALVGGKSAQVEAAEMGPLHPQQRRQQAYRVRREAALCSE